MQGQSKIELNFRTCNSFNSANHKLFYLYKIEYQYGTLI